MAEKPWPLYSGFEYEVARASDAFRTAWQRSEPDTSRLRTKREREAVFAMHYRLVHHDECNAIFFFYENRVYDVTPVWLRYRAYFGAALELLQQQRGGELPPAFWSLLHDPMLLLCRVSLGFYYGGLFVDGPSVGGTSWGAVLSHARTAASAARDQHRTGDEDAWLRKLRAAAWKTRPKAEFRRWFDDTADFVAIESAQAGRADRRVFAVAPQSAFAASVLIKTERVCSEYVNALNELEQKRGTQIDPISGMPLEFFVKAKSMRELEALIVADELLARTKDVLDRAFDGDAADPKSGVKWVKRDEARKFFNL